MDDSTTQQHPGSGDTADECSSMDHLSGHSMMSMMMVRARCNDMMHFY